MCQYFLNNDGVYNAGNYRHIVLLTFLALGNINIEYPLLLAGYGRWAVPASQLIALA